jgi:hypothetical protein
MAEIGEELVLGVIEEACQLASLKEHRALEPRDILFVLGTWTSFFDTNLPTLP